MENITLDIYEISMLTIMAICLIKIIHNMFKLEKIHKRLKKIIDKNNNILN